MEAKPKVAIDVTMRRERLFVAPGIRGPTQLLRDEGCLIRFLLQLKLE